jgi:hypothetical protein
MTVGLDGLDADPELVGDLLLLRRGDVVSVETPRRTEWLEILGIRSDARRRVRQAA